MVRRRRTSVGRDQARLGRSALPGIDVTIADDEVMVRTPTTAARNIDAAFLDRLTDDGWFHTGDLGWFDDDGFLWLDGRVSDMINRGGLKVFPGTVEGRPGGSGRCAGSRGGGRTR